MFPILATQPSTSKRPAPGLLLDRIATPASGAYSFYRKLRTAYTGFAYRMRRESDNALLDVPFAGDFIDVAAVSAFLGAGSGRIRLWYDQSGNGRTLTANHVSDGGPLAYLTGSFVTMGTSKPAVANSSVSATAFMLRNDALGITGAPNLTIGQVRQNSSGGVAPGTFMVFGTTGGGTRTNLLFDQPGAAGTAYPISSFGSATTHSFTGATPVAPRGGYVYRLAAGANWSTASFRQNGVDLVAGATVGDGPLNIANVIFAFGGTLSAFQGMYNFGAVWTSYLSGPELQALEDEQALHYA